MAVALRRADKIKFRPIEFGFFAANELRIVKRRRRGAQGQPVGLGDIVDMIGSDHPTCTRHVLHEDRRVAGDVLAHATRIRARKKIMRIAGQVADDDANRFPLIEGSLRVKRIAESNEDTKEQEALHERLLLREWSVGVLEYWSHGSRNINTPTLHHSNTPLLSSPTPTSSVRSLLSVGR